MKSSLALWDTKQSMLESIVLHHSQNANRPRQRYPTHLADSMAARVLPWRTGIHVSSIGH